MIAIGCGTVGRDDPLGERSCVGVAPWSDLGVVDVCIGSAIATPSATATSAAAGLCVADAARACDDDLACRRGESCRCGRCRVVRCASSAECAADEACIAALGRCAPPCDPAVAGSCPGDLVCSLGGCVAPCAADEDCAHGESCSGRTGHCFASPCDDDGDCAAGWTCEIQAIAADVLHPDPAEDEEGAYVLAEVRRGGRSEVLRFAWPEAGRLAAAGDGPVLEPEADWEGGRVGAPAAVRVGEETWIFYEGGGAAGIGLARGRGRGPFVRAAAAPVLAPATGWEAGRAGSPAALPREDGWPLLFYVGGSEAGVGAARAVGDLPERFERVGASPLLVPQDLAVPDRWTALDGVGDPDAAAVSAGDLPFLFVTAHGRVVAGDGGTPEAERDWSIGAVMLEGDEPPRGWTVDPFGPVLAGRTGVGGASPREERAPGVVRAGGGWRMLYEEWEGDTNVRRLRAAGCP